MTLPRCPLDWPALRGATEPPWGLSAEHAIWGKVQVGPPEFRWLARSPGFGLGPTDPARALRVGAEDSPARAPGWRALPSGYLAVAYYPSRAQDAAGRGGILERQVIEWRPTLGFPAALAALALLPAAAGLEDRLWWDRQHLGRWTDPGFALPLEPLELADLGLDWLDAAVTAGIDELLGRVTQDALRDLYGQVLAGVRPARVVLPDGPLGPLALAALLLPLPAETAASLSLVGWVPVQAPDPTDLAGNWDLAVTGPGPAWPSAALDPADIRQADRLAAALFRRDPGPLLETRPKPRHPTADPLLAALARFAADPGRRLLDMAELSQALAQAPYPLDMPEGPRAHPLCHWVERTAAQRPDWADAVSWDMKVDQLRAAALFLLPHPETLALVGLPQSPFVPTLLPALACPPERVGTHLGDHGEAGLRAILRQSLACPRAEVQARIHAWLTRWLGVIGAHTPLGVLVSESLAEVGATERPHGPGSV